MRKEAKMDHNLLSKEKLSDMSILNDMLGEHSGTLFLSQERAVNIDV